MAGDRDPLTPTTPRARSAATLLAALDVTAIGEDRFEGRPPDDGRDRIFGGFVVAQALVAASRTVAAWAPHSLHATFMRPGDPAAPLEHRVERLRDGRSFATRACRVLQNGVPIFLCTVSFHAGEEGLSHQIAMPEVPPPEALPSEAELLDRYGAVLPAAVRAYLGRVRPVELRPVDLGRYVGAGSSAPEPVQRIWFRSAALPDDPALHRALLAYCSDMTLLDATLVTHRRSVFDPAIQAASLDHVLWFHRPFRADDWLLFAQTSPTASHGLGLARGEIFRRDGVLVASVAQEGLIRPR